MSLDINVQDSPAANPNVVAFRKSIQRLAPIKPAYNIDQAYCLYPAFPVPPGTVEYGFDALADQVVSHHTVRIDGFIGVFWDSFREHLAEALSSINIEAKWIDVSQAQKSPSEIESMVEPFLGGHDPLFGTRYIGELTDFFDASRLAAITPDSSATVTVLYGCGAALVDCEGPLFYVDLPKNELQYRSRMGNVLNLGADKCVSPKEQYKRFYFVDWPVLNRHKSTLINQVDWFIDGQRPTEPTMISGPVLRDALDRMSTSVFRVRPWFEAGPWGGQWLKESIHDLPREESNYAWSFELITPENGIAFYDGRHQLELSFDWLMYHNAREVLGESVKRFGSDFPIRFDFLDTFDGGNLSVQCHPRQDYIHEHFGESFTQDETYYLVDCKPGAEVYLGFQEDIDPDKFRAELEESYRNSTKVDVKKYVNTVPARQHELLLIPNGTIHCSGKDILVLEISATPYIFTFKMYDWLRLGLDGVPRPLNIERAFENLDFERRGDEALRQLISKPKVISDGDGWRVVHLPTHEEHFYDVHRYEFETEIVGETDGSPHVLMVVEGSSVMVETQNGMTARFNFIETFVVPAAAGSYKLINLGKSPVKVIKAFIKAADPL
jgi:mannose-6-phosphate isomerase class I